MLLVVVVVVVAVICKTYTGFPYVIMECLKYLVDNGCSWDSLCKYIDKSSPAFAYLGEKGCKCESHIVYNVQKQVYLWLF